MICCADRSDTPRSAIYLINSKIGTINRTRLPLEFVDVGGGGGAGAFHDNR